MLLDDRNQCLLLTRYVEKTLDVPHETLLDLVIVHFDDVDRPVVKHCVHMAVVELPCQVRLVAHLVERFQRVLDALDLSVWRSPSLGLFT